jgi:hypothetical protein
MKFFAHTAAHHEPHCLQERNIDAHRNANYITTILTLMFI